jgi:hypothetical protein
LGMLGNAKGSGFQFHPCLVYSLDEKQVLGLAGGVTHYRSFRKKNETSTERLARRRESDILGGRRGSGGSRSGGIAVDSRLGSSR